MPTVITQTLLWDGTPFAVTCDGERNVESKPVVLAMGQIATLRLVFREMATFGIIMPDGAASATWFRFELRDKPGPDFTVLFATETVTRGEKQIDIDASHTLTNELVAALGERPAGVFPAMLSGFDESNKRVFTASFVLCIANTTDSEAIPEGAESLTKQIADLDGRVTDLEEHQQDADDVLFFDTKENPAPGQTAFPLYGEDGKIYGAKDTGRLYRWDADESEYVMVGGSEAPTPVAPSTDPSAAGKPADAKATGDALAGKASTADATLADVSVPTDWVFADGLLEAAQSHFADAPWAADSRLEAAPYTDGSYDVWIVCNGYEPGDFDHGTTIATTTLSADGLALDMVGGMPFAIEIVPAGSAVATRSTVSGYQLGSQTNKPIAPAGDYALKSEIPAVPVKAVKRNGTALTPDANGAVNVEVPTGTAATKDVPASGDASSTQVVMGNDSRLSDSRTPTAHASTHATGGSDAITPASIGAQAALTFDDAPTANSNSPVKSGGIKTALDAKQDNMVVLTYGVSTWAEFEAALAKNAIVYCRKQTQTNVYRMAFLAFQSKNEAEFQYYRTIETHTDSQQGDQIFIYTLKKAGNAWTETTREAVLKLTTGSGITKTVSQSAGAGSIQLSLDTSALADVATSGAASDVLLPSGVSSADDLGQWVSMVDQFMAGLPSGYEIICQDSGGDLYRGPDATSGLLLTPPSINGSPLGYANLLPYATASSGTTLAPETAVYRDSLASDGTFPTITDTAIPTSAAYYQFELELAVPSTVPSTITGPSGWTWLDGHGLPDPADLSGGETICISVRLDCTARTFLASVWRVA